MRSAWVIALSVAALSCAGEDDSDAARDPTLGHAGAAPAGTAAPLPNAGSGGVTMTGGNGGAAAGSAAAPVAGSQGNSGNGGASAGRGGSAGAAGGTAGTGMAASGAGGGPGEPSESTIWIATDGDDGNPGTEAMPLASLATAVARATPGTTIWVKPGTYPVAQTVALRADGDGAQPFRLFAAPGERPVFDFMQQPRGESSARGIQISGSYWHLRGIDVINAGDNCIHISGHHNTIERVVTHSCYDTGIQITANSSEAGDPARAAHNLVLNCDSYANYDAQNAGENADGFAAKLYIGPGNVFRGCRAWNNADDGWDFFASDDVVEVDNCWAIANGKIGPGQNNTNGDGNGFKLGGAARAGDSNMGGAVHKVTASISIENRTCGFVRNNNTQLPQLQMCGGRGDGRDMLCSLTNSAAITVTMTAAEAIDAQRDANGNLPPPR